MFLDSYHERDAESVRISAEQGSFFAKDMAGDFNPIHDAGNSRFCVPGDLLFSLALARYGISQHMRFRFAGMVGANVPLRFPPVAESLAITDATGKSCLEIERSGQVAGDSKLIESLACGYVRFSGKNFPGILVPLLEQQGVMLNADRPMVIYDSMWFELDTLDVPELSLSLADSTLEVNGKRGEAKLCFSIESQGQRIGTGAKRMILSGLKPLEPERLKLLVDRYAGWKAAHEALKA